MGVGQFISQYAEKRKRASRLKMHAHNRRLFPGIGNKESVVRTGNNSPGEISTSIGVGSLVDPELIVAEVENEFEGAAGKNALFKMRRFVSVIHPEILNEVREGRSRLV